MSQINYRKTTDENIVVQCPNCKRENTFNRRSDLNSIEPIASRKVECQYLYCRECFTISGDLINPTYEMLLLEARKKIDSKNYRDSVCQSVQAVEVCIEFVLRIDLLYRPFWRERSDNLNKLNTLIEKLSKTLRGGFDRRRSCLLRYMLKDSRVENLSQAEDFINSIPKGQRIPGKGVISSIPDIKTRLLAENIRNTKIHELRNECSHEASCPSLSDAQETLEDAHKIASKLKFHYNALIDDINWYGREENH